MTFVNRPCVFHVLSNITFKKKHTGEDMNKTSPACNFNKRAAAKGRKKKTPCVQQRLLGDKPGEESYKTPGLSSYEARL